MSDAASAADGISGATAAEIAESVRALIERGALAPGDALPPVRALADRLGVNRNTATAAYRLLQTAGLVASAGRGGTRVAEVPDVAREGYAPHRDGLVDVGNGNPDPSRIPPLAGVLEASVGGPVLYGAPVVEPGLEEWATAWMAPDAAPEEIRISVTNGASDAIERLLTASLSRGDAVAIEDPGFLSGIHAIRVGGFDAIGVPVDAEGMTPDGLRAVIAAGARAVIGTPRAQNPTGASVSARRADELRSVLAEHPYLLVIEDDHFSLLSRRPFHSMAPAGHHRYALVRSVSKFLGPDMSLALVASDTHTAERIGMRLRRGTAWVSHLLQRLSLALLTDEAALATIADAGAHYADRNVAFCARLAAAGIACEPGDGLNVWVPVPDGRAAAERLRGSGWVVRPGDAFRVDSAGRDDGASGADRIRVTVHALTDAQQAQLAEAIADASR